MARLEVFGVEGLPEIAVGDDLAAQIMAAANDNGEPLQDRDVVVITSKIVSKAEGCSVELEEVEPSTFAASWAQRWEKDPRVVEVVLRESKRIIRQIGPVLITETHHGFCCANSRSRPVVQRCSWPCAGPAEGFRRLGGRFRRRFAELGVDVAVVISDTFGRPWREGQTDVAIGIAGMHPLYSYIGQHDPHGHEFRVQEICVADELHGGGRAREGQHQPGAGGGDPRPPVDDRRRRATMAPVLRDAERDLFR